MPAGAGSVDRALRTGGRTKQSRKPTTEDGTSGITSAALHKFSCYECCYGKIYSFCYGAATISLGSGRRWPTKSSRVENFTPTAIVFLIISFMWTDCSSTLSGSDGGRWSQRQFILLPTAFEEAQTWKLDRIQTRNLPPQLPPQVRPARALPPLVPFKLSIGLFVVFTFLLQARVVPAWIHSIDAYLSQDVIDMRSIPALKGAYNAYKYIAVPGRAREVPH